MQSRIGDDDPGIEALGSGEEVSGCFLDKVALRLIVRQMVQVVCPVAATFGAIGFGYF